MSTQTDYSIKHKQLIKYASPTRVPVYACDIFDHQQKDLSLACAGDSPCLWRTIRHCFTSFQTYFSHAPPRQHIARVKIRWWIYERKTNRTEKIRTFPRSTSTYQPRDTLWFGPSTWTRHMYSISPSYVYTLPENCFISLCVGWEIEREGGSRGYLQRDRKSVV